MTAGTSHALRGEDWEGLRTCCGWVTAETSRALRGEHYKAKDGRNNWIDIRHDLKETVMSWVEAMY